MWYLELYDLSTDEGVLPSHLRLSGLVVGRVPVKRGLGCGDLIKRRCLGASVRERLVYVNFVTYDSPTCSIEVTPKQVAQVPFRG